ncbi:hypothetical protein PV08_05908 [Exophiala spinifera]|uniref:Uncharacterized protein n=1 Tax=Exophiala spinifera TaxID=91928 RepID=A0A0D2BA37_9EURO|nr:uncharacterized protein PV08_05908 [Exophiala spinifera]KIW15858.1 hypothetical protein PV08_05908 [Exophiala spinifera]
MSCSSGYRRGQGVTISTHPPIFQPLPSRLSPCTVSYPPLHLLGVPQEIRDRIFDIIDEDTGKACAKSLENLPVTGYEALPLICKQLSLETSTTSDWLPRNRIVRHKQVGLFLDWAIYNTPVLPQLQSLTIELPHDSPTTIFTRLAKLFQDDLTGLQELKILGVGHDRYGQKMFWRDERCGKNDTSMSNSTRGRLLIEAQEWKRRMVVINALERLSNLEVLVIDHFNLPVTQAHVLKNKPRLRRLRIGTDERSALHHEMRSSIGNLALPLKESAPALRELNLCANGVLTTFGIIDKVAETLEKLTYTVPDSCHQPAGNINFLHEAGMVLGVLGRKARKLREFRICVHGNVYEIPAHSNFIGNMRPALERMRELEVLEMHMHLESLYLASEFIEGTPGSVERLYLSDQFFCRSAKSFAEILNWQSCVIVKEDIVEETMNIKRELDRRDFIPFSNRLEFIEYEFHSNLSPPQRQELRRLLKINARLLDRARNKHLYFNYARHIPYGVCEETVLSDDVWEDAELLQGSPAATPEEMDGIREDLEQCGLTDNEYFGTENDAYAVFQKEPATKISDRLPASYPCIVAVEAGSEHWLSGR